MKNQRFPTRFHVHKKDGSRTSVSLDNYLSTFLAIKLGHDIKTPEGHAAVRAWLQKRYNSNPSSGMLAQEAIRAICDPKILRKWSEAKYGEA